MIPKEVYNAFNSNILKKSVNPLPKFLPIFHHFCTICTNAPFASGNKTKYQNTINTSNKINTSTRLFSLNTPQKYLKTSNNDNQDLYLYMRRLLTFRRTR